MSDSLLVNEIPVQTHAPTVEKAQKTASPQGTPRPFELHVLLTPVHGRDVVLNAHVDAANARGSILDSGPQPQLECQLQVRTYLLVDIERQDGAGKATAHAGRIDVGVLLGVAHRPRRSGVTDQADLGAHGIVAVWHCGVVRSDGAVSVERIANDPGHIRVHTAAGRHFPTAGSGGIGQCDLGAHSGFGN